MRRCVAVQIDYEDWLEIERLMGERWRKEEPTGARGEDFDALADEPGSSWQGGDGLEYQIRLREEW